MSPAKARSTRCTRHRLGDPRADASERPPPPAARGRAARDRCADGSVARLERQRAGAAAACHRGLPRRVVAGADRDQVLPRHSSPGAWLRAGSARNAAALWRFAGSVPPQSLAVRCSGLALPPPRPFIMIDLLSGTAARSPSRPCKSACARSVHAAPPANCNAAARISATVEAAGRSPGALSRVNQRIPRAAASSLTDALTTPTPPPSAHQS